MDVVSGSGIDQFVTCTEHDRSRRQKELSKEQMDVGNANDLADRHPHQRRRQRVLVPTIWRERTLQTEFVVLFEPGRYHQHVIEAAHQNETGRVHREADAADPCRFRWTVFVRIEVMFRGEIGVH